VYLSANEKSFFVGDPLDCAPGMSKVMSDDLTADGIGKASKSEEVARIRAPVRCRGDFADRRLV